MLPTQGVGSNVGFGLSQTSLQQVSHFILFGVLLLQMVSRDLVRDDHLLNGSVCGSVKWIGNSKELYSSL